MFITFLNQDYCFCQILSWSFWISRTVKICFSSKQFHDHRLKNDCCYVCGPTECSLYSFKNNLKISKDFAKAMKAFCDVDILSLNFDIVPAHVCFACRQTFTTEFNKTHRHKDQINLKVELLKTRKLLPTFTFVHTEENCPVCSPKLGLKNVWTSDKSWEPGSFLMFSNVFQC